MKSKVSIYGIGLGIKIRLEFLFKLQKSTFGYDFHL